MKSDRKLYTVVLVDDEDDIRGRIASNITEETGFQIVGTAGNGYDALVLLDEHDVDVVLTDIRMPFVDGIELTREIRRDHPEIKVAFITGYDEFHYAKEAISLRVDAYLMKPVTKEEIQTFLFELRQTLDTEREQLNEIKQMKQQYNELLPVITDSFIVSLIGKTEMTELDVNTLAFYGLNVTGFESYYTLICCIHEADKYTIQEQETMKAQINQLFKTMMSDEPLHHTVYMADSILFLLSLNDSSKRYLDDLLNSFSSAASRLIEEELLFGVSEQYTSFTELSKSYKQAQTSLRYTALYDNGNTVYFEELGRQVNRMGLLSIQEHERFDRLVQYGSRDDIHNAILDLKTRLATTSTVYVREHILIEVSSLLLHLLEQANVMVSDLFEGNILSRLEQLPSYDELLDLVEEKLIQIQELDNRRQQSNAERIANEAMDYLNQHYTDPNLSLEFLSDHLNLSVSHLSTLFKKQTGTTFSKYLIQLRMTEAQELLLHTSLKIVDIALKVGYNDVYYFSHSFKRRVGVSPREFRKQ